MEGLGRIIVLAKQAFYFSPDALLDSSQEIAHLVVWPLKVLICISTEGSYSFFREFAGIFFGACELRMYGLWICTPRPGQKDIQRSPAQPC